MGLAGSPRLSPCHGTPLGAGTVRAQEDLWPCWHGFSASDRLCLILPLAVADLSHREERRMRAGGRILEQGGAVL